jgi:MoxR-like ATPase
MSKYIPSPELTNAVSVAYKLTMPLLLTGEPGCGKTQCAFWIQKDAYKDVFHHLLRFDVKTTSSARDLFYHYDAIRHFRDAQKKEVNVLDYIHFTALGQAIMASANGHRCVVLIDEVDKAPRDFPNDLLYEVENLKFRIEEATLEDIRTYDKWGDKLELKNLGIQQPAFDEDGVFECAADKNLRPFLLLTSNSEKNLPDAFMRRCAYFHLVFPKKDVLEAILSGQTWQLPSAEIQNKLLETFIKIRDTQGLRKNPGIAEMLNWLNYLSSLDKQTKEELKEAASLLAKNKEDNTQLIKFIDGLTL